LGGAGPWDRTGTASGCEEFSTAPRLLPFWFSREIATYAIDHTGRAFLLQGLVHGLVTAQLLTLLVAVSASVRLRTRLLRPA
jgi:hypothetical protein